jgi:outer membrane protein assembly factor BamB
VTFILQADRHGCKELNRCELGEPADASPAFLDGRIYIRGKKHLYCIGAAEQ